MPLLPTDEQWRAAIEGTDLSIDFWMAAGANEGQARYQAWKIWSHARANGSSDPERPVARVGLTVTKLATAMVAMPELRVAA